MFTITNNFFRPMEMSYLENRFCNIAIEADRYVDKSGNGLKPVNIAEETEIKLEEFIDYAKILHKARPVRPGTGQEGGVSCEP